jgi:hypothetical protein
MHVNAQFGGLLYCGGLYTPEIKMVSYTANAADLYSLNFNLAAQ